LPSRSRTDGELVAPVRMATPFSPPANRPWAQAANVAQSVRVVPMPARLRTFWLRSGQYRSSTDACAKALVAPWLRAKSGLPSILMGRPS
jgi:hypothetical protein